MRSEPAFLAATIPCGPRLISENSTCPAPVQTSPEAFRSSGCGSPPSAGTPRCPSETRSRWYTRCARRPAKRSDSFYVSRRASVVPARHREDFDVTLARPIHVLSPRINASIRPSGESAGWLTESGSFVSGTHRERQTACGITQPQSCAHSTYTNAATTIAARVRHSLRAFAESPATTGTSATVCGDGLAIARLLAFSVGGVSMAPMNL